MVLRDSPPDAAPPRLVDEPPATPTDTVTIRKSDLRELLNVIGPIDLYFLLGEQFANRMEALLNE